MRCERCGKLNGPGLLHCVDCGNTLLRAPTRRGFPAAAAPEEDAPAASEPFVPVDALDEEDEPGEIPREIKVKFGVDLGKRTEDKPIVKASGKEMGSCSLCHGVFRRGQIFEIGGQEVCETCLPRAEKQIAGADAGDRSKSDDRSKKRYLKQQVIADRLRDQGRSATVQSITWPKCAFHPDRSTKDACTRCRKPVCAMCARRRSGAIYCPGCFAKGGAVSSRTVSAKFSGFSGSYLETVQDVLLAPSVFFRNLPTRGEVARPFLFALLNWIPGNAVLVLGISLAALQLRGVTLQADMILDLIQDELFRPLLYGVPVLSLAFAALGWVPFHILASVFGGKAPAEKGFRMVSLASAFSLLNIIPFVGVALAPLWAAVVLIRAVTEVYEVGLIAGFFVFLLGFGTLVAGAVAFFAYFVFA